MAPMKSMLLCACACTALASNACSGAGSVGSGGSTPSAATGAGATRHGWMSPAAKKQKLVYVSDYTASIVLVYAQGATGSGPIGEIVDGVSSPQGIAVDASGTLYVANYGGNTITEYPAGATSPSVTLSSGLLKPLDVSVDSNGTLYVSESSSNVVLEYKKGSTSPDVTITSLTHPNSVTNAKNNSLYVTYNSDAGHVARCKPLSTKCKDLGISVQLATAVELDSKGNLLVGDVFGEVIDIYARGQTNPFRVIDVTNEDPGKIAFDSKDKTLYMADPANFAVRLYDYASGSQTGTFTFGPADELEGIALFPGQKPG